MIINTAQRISTVEEYYFSKKLKEIRDLIADGKDIINLGIGSPDLPPHPEVIKELHRFSDREDTHGYQSYYGTPELRNAFSNWAKDKFNISVNSDEVLPLMGSKEGIMHLSMTFLQKGNKALIPNPGYPTYTSAAKLAGADVIYYDLKPENDYWPDFNHLENLDTKNIKIMWINYPHMPTGKKASFELFQKLVKFAQKHKILLCHDNPYTFILNEKPLSIMKVNGAMDCAVELHSLSKAYNMAGWRIGALFGNTEILSEVIKFKSNMDSGMFKPLQLAGIKALSLDQSWHDEINRVYTERRKIVFDIFDTLNCTYNRKQTGLFVWAKIPEKYDTGIDFSDEYLYNYDVFMTPGNIFGSQGNKYVRISLCSKTEDLKRAFRRVGVNAEKNLSL